MVPSLLFCFRSDNLRIANTPFQKKKKKSNLTMLRYHNSSNYPSWVTQILGYQHTRSWVINIHPAAIQLTGYRLRYIPLDLEISDQTVCIMYPNLYDINHFNAECILLPKTSILFHLHHPVWSPPIIPVSLDVQVRFSGALISNHDAYFFRCPGGFFLPFNF